MDDFIASNLYSSRDEWAVRLINILCPMIKEGIQSIFIEAQNMCMTTKEPQKYLLTFQNMLSSIRSWNATIIEEERKRIVERSGCGYLEDLITCVHIVQLKVLTYIRVGNKQKKIDISIPNLDTFIHKCYINSAKKIYSNVYLYETGITQLMKQRNQRELEQMIQESILQTIRDSIPTESLIRSYLDESVEEEEEVYIEKVPEVEPPSPTPTPTPTTTVPTTQENEELLQVPSIRNMDDNNAVSTIVFDEYDHAQHDDGTESKIHVPKTGELVYKDPIMPFDDDETQDELQILNEPIDISAISFSEFDGSETVPVVKPNDNDNDDDMAILDIKDF